MTTIPEPSVRVARTWTFSYQRPRIDGWPLLKIGSSFTKESRNMVPKRIVVTIQGGVIARTILNVVAHGHWADGGERDTIQELDLPNHVRRNATLAPGWVEDIVEDALQRSKKE